MAVKRPEKPARLKRKPPRSPCPIAGTLDLVGDKWTLLIVRDLLFFGKRQYRDLAASPEGIPSNILADRLRRLERAGLVEKTPYQDRPPRFTYTLTPCGADLKPVLLALIEWGNRNIPGTFRPTAAQLRRARTAGNPPARRRKPA